MKMRTKIAALVAMITLVAGYHTFAAKPNPVDQRKKAYKQMQAGNYRVALSIYKTLANDPKNRGALAGQDLERGLQCLRNLARVNEVEEFRNTAIASHQKDWRFLQSAAKSLMHGQHHGYIVAGKFHRGNHRGGGKFVGSDERDRVEALRLYEKTEKLLADEKDKQAASTFYLDYANAMLYSQYGNGAWRLQVLTNLKELPDYEENYRYARYYRRGVQGAPVDKQGNPVYYKVPKSLQDSKNDGERWRWMLTKAMQIAPNRSNEIQTMFAQFLQQQFGVQTMAGHSILRNQETGDHAEEGESTANPYALHTLKENETIAKLATGAKRFTLPDEFNFIKIYQNIAGSGKDKYAQGSLDILASIFENRRQYPKAAESWKRGIDQYGAGSYKRRQKRLDQIINNWARFESAQIKPAGEKARVEIRFRNSDEISFTAQTIKVEKLLEDVKNYIRTKPAQFHWKKLNISNLGYRLVTENQQKYLGKQAAAWNEKLIPAKNHYDRRKTITTPLTKAGAYLLTAKTKGGNTSRIIIWITDTAIASKNLNGKRLYYVADALTGQPIKKANLEFFGYQIKNIKVIGNRWRQQVNITNFAEFTDANGQVIPDPADLKTSYNWLITARTKTGRFAYIGFQGVWYNKHHNYTYDHNKVFTITDRPVYRPNQKVKFKFWVRKARYDLDQASKFADKNFNVVITDPKGKKVLEKQFRTDGYGGFDGEYELPEDATLGIYSVQIKWDNKNKVGGGGRFRVEEYKKPEFEVIVDAPKEPVMLGDKITATITAKYYFGAPVTHAKVKYKVTRTNYDQQWYPIAEWDWFYGAGYWWFADNYDFYPGWKIWNSCFRPIPPWWGHRSDPPEVVFEREVEIGEDGIVKVEIDTAIAKAVHADQDHKYQITAEVIDQSRRTIVGSGQVLVARKPFKVFAWMNRGHYETGDTAVASFKAQTLDNKPIKGNGKLTLFSVSYDEKGKLTEKEVFTVDVNTDDKGEAKHKFKVPDAGQFRVSYKVTDGKKHTIEGGYLFNVIGKDDNGSGYKFNDLELVLDKREYKPGDKVKVLINTNRENSTVLLFVRPLNGIYSKPTTIRLDGKNNVHEITVAKKDMPNFFVEAITVSNGKLHSITREVIVPPEQRVAKIEVLPSSKDYRPGADAKINLKLTDIDGKPFIGSTVVSVYDKSVEYISGGSSIPEIRAHFWKWRRQHYPQTDSNLGRYFGNLSKNDEIGMGNIGRFGHLVSPLKGKQLENSNKPGRSSNGLSMNDSAAFAPETLSRISRGRPEYKNKKESSKKMKNEGRDGKEEQNDKGGRGTKAVEPVVRKNFADTALWVGAITTNDDGTAEVSLKMPENLTTWKIRVWSMGHGTRVGQGEAEVVTSKNLIIRLQAPRFFVETDEVVLTANVHNYLKTEKTAQVVLALEGNTLKPMGRLTQTVKIPAGGEAKVDWRVKVTQEGLATITMKALTDEESDAMQMKFPVYVHGMLKTESFTGTIRPDKKSATVNINVPQERKPAQSRLEVRFSPTLAGAMVDALPYLTSYPYKTSDTTLHRFVPTVITQNILKRMGLNLKEIEKKRTNLNAQEIGDDKERAKRWKQYKHNPVFNEAEVEKMVKRGLKDLTSMQNGDGGWGWFYGYGCRSSAYQTALVVHGLQIAQQNDVALVPNMMKRGETWLKSYQDRQVQLLKNEAIWDAMSKEEKEKKRNFHHKTHADNLDAFVYMVLADAKVLDDNMNAFLYRDRTKLSVHSLALFGLALHQQNDVEKLKMVIQNIDQFLIQDNENDTAYLKLPGNFWWYWYGSEIEANAYYLKLLAKTDPKGEKAARLAKYIINNRRYGTYWRSTRDTAVAIEALAEYMQKSGEDKPDMTVQVFYDGQKMKEVKINKENLFSFDNRFVITGLAVADGKHKIELKRTGKGRVYFNAYLTNFTQEEFITKAGLEIKVNRKFYKLIRDDKTEHVAGARGQAVGQKVEKYKREELANLSTIQAGDLIEVELEIDSKNDYEKVIFEDMKVAGFEPVDLRSGYNNNSMRAYMELRDERVTFFVENLARGKHSVSYKLRAEIPGKYSALPAKGSGMYAPELRANSDEWKVQVEDTDLIHVKAAAK